MRVLKIEEMDGGEKEPLYAKINNKLNPFWILSSLVTELEHADIDSDKYQQLLKLIFETANTSEQIKPVLKELIKKIEK